MTRAIKLINQARPVPAHARHVHPTWSMAIQQILRCYQVGGKLAMLNASYPAWQTRNEGIQPRQVDVYGFSAGSFTGLAIHAILCDFNCFPGITQVAAIAIPAELMQLATGDRQVKLIQLYEDKLCVWRPPSTLDLNYDCVIIQGYPKWSGRAHHSYAHLLFAPIPAGWYEVQQLQRLHPDVKI